MGNQTLKPGDIITIAGIERGSNGQLLVNGVNIKTNRKCKPVGLAKLAMAESGASSKQSQNQQ